jgi:hypothetical protein
MLSDPTTLTFVWHLHNTSFPGCVAREKGVNNLYGGRWEATIALFVC